MSPNAREPVDPGSRPLPAAATIAVAGLSAALVIAGGVLIAERVVPRRSAAPLAATPLPSMALPVEESGRAAAPIVSAATIASATAAPIVSAAPIVTATAAPIVSAATIAIVTATAAPIVSAATIATAAPVATAAGGGDPAGLPADRGYLVLGGAAGARAFVNGANVGAADERIAVPCGARYVRLGTIAEPGKPPTWVTAGRSVVVACRGETRIELKP
jgi:hypothetical protein